MLELTHDQNHMNTTVRIRLVVEPGQEAGGRQLLGEAHGLLAQVEDELSEFRPESSVAKFNAATVGEPLVFSEQAFVALARTIRLENWTRGKFSPFAKSKVLPCFSESAVQVDPQLRRVTKLRADAWLSFGAFGKGFAVDQVAALFMQEGFRSFLINAGGSSQFVSGLSVAGKPWRLGWSWKNDGEGRAQGVAFDYNHEQPIALGVSGTHEKGGHILDPRNSRSLTSFQSSFIAAHSAADADALSTAVFVGGEEEWQDSVSLISRMPIPSPAMAAIDQFERPMWNGNFQRWFGALSLLTLVMPLAQAQTESQAQANESEEEAIDLGAEEEVVPGEASVAGAATGAPQSQFLPYVFDRNPYWVLLPVFMILFSLLHAVRPKGKKDSAHAQANANTNVKAAK